MTGPNSKLKSALRAADRGFRVFPLRPGTKLPAHKGWQDEATRDPEVIQAWWRDMPDYNVGWAMGGQLPDGRFLVTIDVDAKLAPGDLEPKENGEESLRILLQEAGVAPESIGGSFCQLTPSGWRPNGQHKGGHLVMTTSYARRQLGMCVSDN